MNTLTGIKGVRRDLAYAPAMCTVTAKDYLVVGYLADQREFDPDGAFYWHGGPVFLTYGEAVPPEKRTPGVPIGQFLDTFTEGAWVSCPHCGSGAALCSSCGMCYCKVRAPGPDGTPNVSGPIIDFCPACGRRDGEETIAGSKRQLLGRF